MGAYDLGSYVSALARKLEWYTGRDMERYDPNNPPVGHFQQALEGVQRFNQRIMEPWQPHDSGGEK